jgi:DNA-binding IclR family transcriptional regulator
LPIFDHTASIRLVIAVIGSSGSFDEGPQGPTGRALLAAAQRLSWRFGALGTTGTTLSASNMQRR